MSMGIGKRYLVQRIDGIFGTLEEILKFIEEHRPDSDHEWFELWPQVDIKNKSCVRYQVALVRMPK